MPTGRRKRYPSEQLPRLTIRIKEDEQEALRKALFYRKAQIQEVGAMLISAWLAAPDAMERAAHEALKEE